MNRKTYYAGIETLRFPACVRFRFSIFSNLSANVPRGTKWVLNLPLVIIILNFFAFKHFFCVYIGPAPRRSEGSMEFAAVQNALLALIPQLERAGLGQIEGLSQLVSVAMVDVPLDLAGLKAFIQGLSTDRVRSLIDFANRRYAQSSYYYFNIVCA